MNDETDARVFVDTNILLYARDGNQPSKQLIAAAWMTRCWRERRA